MKIIKRIFLFTFTALLLGITVNTSAQQISLFDHYFYNPIINNPAFTGNKETTNIMLLSRTQWTGFKGAPKLNALSIDGNIFNEKMGLGAILFNDSKGINKTIGGNLLYSYRVNLSEISHLNFGVAFRFLSHTVNFSEATVENVSDPTLFNTEQSKTNFNGDLGLAYFWKNLEIGVAADQILANKTSYFNEAGNDISYTPTYHFINSVKYTFQINEEKQLKLTPQALVRYIENSPLQYEINTNVYYKNMFWVGAAYKNDYAVSTNAGISLLNKFDIGYSYTFITTDIGQQAGMTHEIMLNYKFGKKEKKEKIEEEEIPIKEEEPIEKEEIKIEEENGIKIIKATVDDFETPQFKTPKPGFYVIVGTFSYRELADNYANKVKNKGFNQASFIYSQDDNFNYVYIFVEQSKEDALNKVKEARENGTKDAWIIILTK